jgi:hypothetical protein
MKIRLLCATLICAFAAASGLRAEDAKPKPAAAAKAETTELEDTMEKLNGALRKLKRQVADVSKNEDSLKLVAIIRESMETALQLEPAMKADKPVADQGKFVAEYRAKMKATIEEIVKLENALKAGSNDEAAKIIAALDEAKKGGHKEFKRPAAKK